MIKNKFEVDVKIKCIENDTTQEKVGEAIGTTGQYVNRVIKHSSIVNKTFVKIMEELGYDIKVTYVPREVK